MSTLSVLYRQVWYFHAWKYLQPLHRKGVAAFLLPEYMDTLPESKNKASGAQAKDAKDLVEQYNRDFSNISEIRSTWEDKEAMLLGVPTDSQTKSTKSKVFDPRLSTFVFERAARVSAQTPTGRVQALTSADTGKSMLMNLILKNYVYPNARTQFDLITKSRLLDVYSNVYGSFGWLVDYHVRSDYVGPDVSLIPVRNIVPQSGKHNDLDYLHVRSVVSKKWLLGRDTKNWKNIDKLLEQTSNKAVQDTDYSTYNERTFDAQSLLSAEQDDFEQIEIITRYEPDRWITFSRDTKLILRDIPNPQQNGRIPVVMKHAFPLLDRFFGLGEFERGQTLQMAINSLINLYLDGVKMSIFPPLKIYLPDLVAKTISYEPAAKWILKSNNPAAISEMQFSPQGINSFNSTYQFLLAALSNQAGTTDTTITSSADITQGKTPQALKMVANRENARDNWDRFMLEKALEETFDRFIDLLSTRQEKPIKLNLFADEIKMIQQANPDLGEMYESGKYGELVIKPTDINDTKYKFFIDAGSSMKLDDQDQNAALTSIMGLILKLPGALDQAMHMGKVIIGNQSVDVGEVFKRWITTSGVGQADKIIQEASPEEQQKMQQMLQAMQQAQQPQQQSQPIQKPPKSPTETLNYKDAPADIQRQIEQQAGLQPSQMGDLQAHLDMNKQIQDMTQQGQQAGMQQPQQSVNFEDPANQQLLQGQGNDPVAQIMQELGGVANGNSGAIQ